MHILKKKITIKTIIATVVALCLLALTGILIDRQWSINAGLVCWIIVVGGIPIGFLVRWAFEKLRNRKWFKKPKSNVPSIQCRPGEVSEDEFPTPSEVFTKESWPEFVEA